MFLLLTLQSINFKCISSTCHIDAYSFVLNEQIIVHRTPYCGSSLNGCSIYTYSIILVYSLTLIVYAIVILNIANIVHAMFCSFTLILTSYSLTIAWLI